MTAAPLYTAAITPNRRLDAYGIDTIPATTGEVLGATFEDAWTRSPGPSLWRWTKRELTVSTERYLTQDQANRDFGIEGELSFDGPVPPHVARDLHTLKRAELQRRSIMQRGEGGLGEDAARLAVGFAAGLLDPLNIATAFVPVVGPARYGAMLAGAAGAGGRAAVRLGVGAVEGAAGAALAEPLVYGVARQEQADYGAVDSLLNLAFGTVLGGGLHSLGGAVGDMVAPGRWRAPGEALVDGLPVETQQAALNLSVAAVADGRPVDGVDAVIAAEQAKLTTSWNNTRATPKGPADDPLVRITPDDIEGVIVARGGYKGLGDVEVKGQGWGLVKFIWRHGPESGKPPEQQIIMEDLLAFPRIIRERESRSIPRNKGAALREWRVMLPGADGKERMVVFADNVLDGREGRHLVTLYVQEPDRTGADVAPSPMRTGPPESLGKELEISTEDTAPEHVARPRSQHKPAPQNHPGSRRGPAPRNMGRRGLQSNLGEVYDTAGRRLDVRYEVVESHSLTVSHTDGLTENPRYPQELQPRDRTRAASNDQIRDIVARFEPAFDGSLRSVSVTILVLDGSGAPAPNPRMPGGARTPFQHYREPYVQRGENRPVLNLRY